METERQLQSSGDRETETERGRRTGGSERVKLSGREMRLRIKLNKRSVILFKKK